MKKRVAMKAVTWAAYAAALAPAWLILRYGVDMPFWDQWSIAYFFEKSARGSLTLSDLFKQENEFRQFFPHLIFVALGRVTRWNVKYEMLVCLLLACLVAACVRRLGALTFADPFRGSVLFLLASLLIFSAMQYENWLFGVQVVYFMPVVCVTAGLLVAYSERVGVRAALLTCACLSAVSTFSSANGLVCWLVLPPALLAARPQARAEARHWLPLWGAGLVLCMALYAYGYRSVSGHPSPAEALRHPFHALAFFVAFLGGPLAASPSPPLLTLVIGACALSAYGLACAYLFRLRDDSVLLLQATPWLMLGAYSLVTGVLVTVGRLGFGVGQALSPRYATFSLYLMVALVYLLPRIVEDAASKGYLSAKSRALLKRLGAASAVLLVLAHLIIFVLVVRGGAANWQRMLLRGKACLLFIEVAPEEHCLAKWVYPDVRMLREKAEALDRMGYLRPPLVRDGRMRDLAAAAGCSDAYGSFDLLPSEGGAYVAAGGARLPHRGEQADAVVLAFGRGEEDQTAFALAEISAADSGDGARWRKTLPAAALPAWPQVELTAWAFDAEEGKAYRLCGTHTLRLPG